MPRGTKSAPGNRRRADAQFQGIEQLHTVQIQCLTSDAPQDKVAAFLLEAARKTRHPRILAIAQRELKPLGGRRGVDRTRHAQLVQDMLDKGTATTPTEAARYVARTMGHSAMVTEESEAKMIKRAWKALRRPE